jgi:YVTN family beta-propeller protein
LDEAGEYHDILRDPVHVSSDDVGLGQVLLGEGFVPSGQYVGLRLVFSEASVTSRGKRANLILPADGGNFTAELNMTLNDAESTVLSLEWNPSRTIEKKVVFAPAIIVEAQRPSAQGLLLFVSNSGANYVTVIDRSLERVIGAVTVGDAPMGMVFNQAKDMLYVLNSRSHNISVIDVLYLELRDTIEITSGMGATDMVFMPDEVDTIEGRLYVNNKLSNDVVTIDTASSRVMKTIAVGNGPSYILADTDRREVYVTNKYSNSLSIINTVDDVVVATITVDDNPSGLALGEDDLYVFNESSNTISVVSQSDRDVTDTLVVSEPPGRGRKAFDERFFVLNTLTNKMTFFNRYDVMTAIREVGSGPVSLVADEDRNRIYVLNFNSNTVSIVDPKGEKVVGELVVGSNPYGVLLLDK